jgi:hypothetical protein
MKTSINLLPASFQRQLMVRRRALQWTAILSAGLTIGGVIRWIDLREHDVLSQQLDLLAREHQPTQVMLQQLVDMRRELADLEQLEKIAQELEYQRPALSLLGIISAAGEATGGKLRVTGLELIGLQQESVADKSGTNDGTRSGLTLTGVAIDNPSVAKLVSGLEASGFFRTVELVKSKVVDGNDSLREYQVRCEL